jgi:two-component system, OmpR family, sensor histidine kinase BaeS
LSIVTLAYYLWIRHVFAPVHLIIDRLNSYIDSSRFATIGYTRSDEFSPLVTTINSLYKSLRVQENVRSNFLSDISHEIRTPITAVRCYLEAIEDGMMSLDTKTVPLLQTELTRLTSITEQIMEYESLTHHVSDDVRVERFDIYSIIDEIIYEYSPQLDRIGQKILFHGNIGSYIRMDKNMFIQILHNIFSNSIKYAGMHTTLDIRYTRQKDATRIEFSDNGIGIPTDEVSLVREKFYRVDKSRTRDSKMSMGI